MVEDIVHGEADIRGQPECGLFGKFDHPVQQQRNILADQLRITALKRDLKRVFEKVVDFAPGCADLGGGDVRELVMECEYGRTVQMQERLSGVQFELQPIHFGNRDGDGVGAVHLIGLGDEHIPAAQVIGFIINEKTGGTAGDIDQFIAVFVEMQGKRFGCGYAHLLGKHLQSRDIQIGRREDFPIPGIRVIVLPIDYLIHAFIPPMHKNH